MLLAHLRMLLLKFLVLAAITWSLDNTSCVTHSHVSREIHRGATDTEMKSYKFRIYPNRQQVQILSETIETCRSLYNQSLLERLKDKSLKYYEQKRNLTQKRKVIASLKHVHSQVLQNVVWRLEMAFQNYHRDRKIGQPKFKRHGRYNSITYPQYGSFCIKENKLKLAFLDGLIKLKLHRPFVVEKIKTCTILRDIDRWFACFSSCNNDIQKSSSSDIVGVDLGLLNWMM